MKFPFGADYQRRLLRMVMTDEAFCHRVMKYVEPGFFTSQSLGWVFKVMQQYYRDYSTRCTEMPLREALRYAPEHTAEVNAVIAIGHVTEHEYVKDELKEFIRRNLFARAHLESQELYNSDKHDSAYDVMCRAMDSLRTVEFEGVDRSWFFDQLPDRQRARMRHAADPTDGVYPTGMDPIDDLMDGGPKRGELHIVIGDAKVGKTTWLINRGFVATRVSRVPVVHFNLEGRTQLVEDRYDACFSNELYTAVKHGEITSAVYKEMVAEYQTLRRLLVIRTLNEWDVTILDIEAELKELESEGFIPEMIILDYADLLRSRSKYARSETEHQMEGMRDLKRLTNRGYMTHTASQTIRPKDGDEEKERIWRAKDIADAYAKIRICDAYGSLNQTLKEFEDGSCRYFLENYRDGAVGKLFKLQNDRARMRLATSVTPMSIPVKTKPTAKPKKKKASSGP